MGDINQVILLRNLVRKIDGPVLEIGSKHHGNTSSFRDFYIENSYVGIDAEDGPGVDSVFDLNGDVSHVPSDHFALCICTSVLEHVSKPWVAAKNIESFLRRRGILYISVPWVWRYHPYPDDYYRFSPSGIKVLFENIDFYTEMYSTSLPGEIMDMAQSSVTCDNAMALHKKTDHGERKYLPYLMVNMIGKKT